MLNWLRKLLRVDEESLLERIDALEEEVEELRDATEEQSRAVELELADLYDQILPLLKRLQNRAAVRESREKTKDINTSSERKGGIIRGSLNGTDIGHQEGYRRG